jgi:hypothetical protein
MATDKCNCEAACDHPGPHDLVRVADAPSLFVQDRELHQLINPRLGWDRFRAAVKVWERDGFPKINSLIGGRYWRAVVAWLDSHYAAQEKSFAEEPEDGPEDFGRGQHATTRESTRLQARPRPEGRNGAAILDGAPGRAQSDGISRLMHPPSARR